jgi:hypothetical protein
MTQTDEPQPVQPSVTLDYGHKGSNSSPWYSRLWNEIQQRVAGILEFFGLIIYYLGGTRRIGLAIGSACLAGGLGLCLDKFFPTDGPCWMSIGGFLLGLLLPAPVKRD